MYACVRALADPRINRDTIDAVTKEIAEQTKSESSSSETATAEKQDREHPDYNEEIKRRLQQIMKARLTLMIPYMSRWPQVVISLVTIFLD